MTKKLRRFLALIGPYPYNPYLIFLFASGLLTSQLSEVALRLPPGEKRIRAMVIILLVSLACGGFYAAIAWAFNKFRLWSSKSLVFYILEVAFTKILFVPIAPIISNFFIEKFGYDILFLPGKSTRVFIATLVLVLFSLALMHRAEKTILDRLSKATQLVGKLRADREELIRVDEEVREQTSRFLHDHVQSDLMVIAMKLKSIDGKSSQEVNEVVKLVISQLEATRSFDLKNLMQTLTPNFEVGGLRHSVEAMSEKYRPSMAITFNLDLAAEKYDPRFLLGNLRIIEQSLINSLIHGPAKKVHIDLRTNGGQAPILTVSDDGPGGDLELMKSGMGSAIIDSWIGILNGKKTVDTVPGHGYRLVVNFPA